MEKSVGETWSDPAVGQVVSEDGPYVMLVGSGFLKRSVENQANRGGARGGDGIERLGEHLVLRRVDVHVNDVHDLLLQVLGQLLEEQRARHRVARDDDAVDSLLADDAVEKVDDLVPADLVGTRIYNQKTGDFHTSLGPVFCNLLLADEINRAPAKVQSALLEVMQERQVTIAGETHRVPEPFLVMATQNPIETEGTYPLPEAQVDRFMMKVLVDYPTEEEEFVIVERVTGLLPEAHGVASTEELGALQRECRKGWVEPSLMQYAVRLSAATRDPERFGIKGLSKYITYGASPRASVALLLCSKALAAMSGRDFATPDDVKGVALATLRHRISLRAEAELDGATPDAVINDILNTVEVPR